MNKVKKDISLIKEVYTIYVRTLDVINDTLIE